MPRGTYDGARGKPPLVIGYPADDRFLGRFNGALVPGHPVQADSVLWEGGGGPAYYFMFMASAP